MTRSVMVSVFASGKNNIKLDEIQTVRKRKELLPKEVAKNEPRSLIDQWMHDKSQT